MSGPVEGNPFRVLVHSTLQFRSRFDVFPELPYAAEHFKEEVGEFTAALIAEADKTDVAEEAADVLVTLLWGSLAAGLSPEDLVRGIDTVIAKNDAKRPKTHEVRYGKMRRGLAS